MLVNFGKIALGRTIITISDSVREKAIETLLTGSGHGLYRVRKLTIRYRESVGS